MSRSLFCLFSSSLLGEEEIEKAKILTQFPLSTHFLPLPPTLKEPREKLLDWWEKWGGEEAAFDPTCL